MGNQLQSASSIRKLVYLGAVAVLFTLTLFWRGVIPSPLSGQTGEWLDSQTIESRAVALDLSETARADVRDSDQGASQVTGSALRLGLTGSRGFATCVLWLAAIDKQKKHEWNSLELLVNALTKLQPHFLTPWLFQSWNLAWNVSVEFDQLRDVYFYITRGIQLLSRGESVNRDNPDLRYSLGFYYQNRFGVHDKVDTLRAYFSMSCIPPSERDPTRFWDAQTGQIIDRDEFRTFCENNPMLVRRLKQSKWQQPILYQRDGRDPESGLSLESPEQIAEFLYAGREIPARFDLETGEMKSRLEQFPVLTPSLNPGESWRYIDEPLANESTLGPDYDAFLTSRAWFQYSLLPLPDPQGVPVSVTEEREKANREGKRIPRQPMMIIFRQGSPRAQSYHASWLEREGWFDGDGWEIDQGAGGGSGTPEWFPRSASEEPVIVGAQPGLGWARVAWDRAFDMWTTHGEQNGLLMSDAELQDLQERAIKLQQRGIAGPNDLTPEPNSLQRQDDELMDAFRAHRMLTYYRQNLDVTNFIYFREQARAEGTTEAIKARKHFLQARQDVRNSFRPAAFRNYVAGFELWKEMLDRHPLYHRHPKTDTAQSDLYTWWFEFEALLKDMYGTPGEDVTGQKFVRNQLAGTQQATFAMLSAATGTPLANLGTAGIIEQLNDESTVSRAFPRSPVDGLASDGRPWVEDNVVRQVSQRYNRTVDLPPESGD